MLNENGMTAEEFMKMGAEIEPEVAEVETEETEVEEKDIVQALQEQFPGAPDREQIERWKTQFGRADVFVPPADTRAYIFRPVSRIEWKRISAALTQFAGTAAAQQDKDAMDNMLHEKVVEACLLWPTEILHHSNVNMLPAGLLQTLFQLIMEASSFMSPERALNSTYRL